MCQRPACAQPAAGRLGYDADALVITIDRFVDAGGGVALLCETHMARMTAPRGWQLDDQRIAQRSLFPLDAVLATTSAEASSAATPSSAEMCSSQAARSSDEHRTDQASWPAGHRSGNQTSDREPVGEGLSGATITPLRRRPRPALVAQHPVATQLRLDEQAPEVEAPIPQPRGVGGPLGVEPVLLEATTPLLARAFAQPRERRVAGGIGALLGIRAAG